MPNKLTAEDEKDYNLEAWDLDPKVKEADTQEKIKVYSPFWKPAKATPPEVVTCLRLVAEGEQDQVEAMLKANPRLGLEAGSVTDLSKRTFTNITALQYAIWALDWNMWLMLLKYIPRDEAHLQAMALEENGTAHGKHFDFSQLLSAYRTYEQNFAAWSSEQCAEYWCKQVGGAQLLLPVHVINEYCRLDRPFYPVPDFKQEGLPRVREVYGKSGTDVHKHQDTWGVQWALIRCNGKYAFSDTLWEPFDGPAVTALSEVRLQQQQELMRELLRNKPLLETKG